jgi:hypothetical protein
MILSMALASILVAAFALFLLTDKP